MAITKLTQLYDQEGRYHEKILRANRLHIFAVSCVLRSCSIDARCKVACKHVRLGQFELFGLSTHQICSQLSNTWICDCASHREAWNNHSYHLFVQFDKNH